MKRSKHGLCLFPPKKTLIWRRHCSIGQSCCSMTSKRSIDWFLESSSGMKFFLTIQKPRAFVSVRQTNQIALFPFVCCFCFVRASSFQGHTKIALSTHRSKLRLHSHNTGQIFDRLKNLTGHFVHTEPFSIFALFKTPKRTQFSTHPLPCERSLSSVVSLIPNQNIAWHSQTLSR